MFKCTTIIILKAGLRNKLRNYLPFMSCLALDTSLGKRSFVLLTGC